MSKEYGKTLLWLNELNQNKIKPGLERIKKLMNLAGNPQNELRIIAVGGTNAKGSTCFNLNHTLMQTNKKIGCFTSPHIHSVRERIKIDNKIISKKEFAKYLLKIKELSEQNNLRITYFETLTALAYVYFSSKNVDYAIMEIGLGGEWDAVNVADAEIAILTTLGLDHVDYLGDSLEKIAATKAKIVRKNATVITGWDEKYHKYIPKSKKIIKGLKIADWIKACTEVLEFPIEPIIMNIPGRQEKHLNFTIDTAHNEQAIEHILSIDNNYKVVILGMLVDKDIEAFVAKLPADCTVSACNLNSERSASSDYIYEICDQLNVKCRKFKSVKDAISSSTGEKTLITGSFYTVSEAREHFELEGYSEL